MKDDVIQTQVVLEVVNYYLQVTWRESVGVALRMGKYNRIATVVSLRYWTLPGASTGFG